MLSGRGIFDMVNGTDFADVEWSGWINCSVGARGLDIEYPDQLLTAKYVHLDCAMKAS
jgi:hypothetical protein